jgi:hypothetical protein
VEKAFRVQGKEGKGERVRGRNGLEYHFSPLLQYSNSPA